MTRDREWESWREEIPDFAADHVADELGFVCLRGRCGKDGRAVAEDGDAVGEGEDFVETVRDVDTAQAASAEVAKDREERLDFVLGERGAWPVMISSSSAAVSEALLHVSSVTSVGLASGTTSSSTLTV